MPYNGFCFPDKKPNSGNSKIYIKFEPIISDGQLSKPSLDDYIIFNVRCQGQAIPAL